MLSASKTLFIFCFLRISVAAVSSLILQDTVTIPSSFEALGPVPDDWIIDFRVALKSADMTGLEKRLYQVSTPGSSDYGRYLSPDELKLFVTSSPGSQDVVTSWLKSNNIPATVQGAFSNYIIFSIPASKANTLLNAKYVNFTHTPTGQSFVRTADYSLPLDIAPHLTLVHPTTDFAPPVQPSNKIIFTPTRTERKRKAEANVATRANTVPASCQTSMTPTCLETLYGLPNTPATHSNTNNNLLAVAGMHSNWVQKTDVQTFLKTFQPNIPSNTTFDLISVANGTNPQQTGFGAFETSLDVEYTIGLAAGVPLAFMSVANISVSFVNSMLDLANYLSTTENPPKVVTTSYGASENGFSTASLTQICNAFMAASARGISILFASGDSGSEGAGGVCGSNNSFIAPFPASCPYITSIGSTHSFSPEIASNFSSGGFSNIFPRPSYQSSLVSTYLSALGSTYQGMYNASGRATPDLSAQGENIPIWVNGRQATEEGTSCSSPIFASVVALVNDRLIAAGKPVLGFLNPFIYAHPEAFTDIVNGSNPGCNTTGFPALKGWDPVTGVGTPSFPALLSALGL